MTAASYRPDGDYPVVAYLAFMPLGWDPPRLTNTERGIYCALRQDNAIGVMGEVAGGWRAIYVPEALHGREGWPVFDTPGEAALHADEVLRRHPEALP